jgi:cell division septation protein DedD
MSSESGPEDRKEPELGTAASEETEAPDIDPAEQLASTEPDRLPPWLGMPDDDVKVSRFSPGLITAGVAALVIFGAIVWVVYHQAGERGNLPPPVITADNQPTKVQPESPGGTEVPNQDKTVYDRINPNAPEEPERILPPAEEPKGLEPQQSTAEQTPPPETEAPTPKEVAPAPPPKAVAQTEPKPTPPPPAAPKTQPSATSGSYLIQLGAFGDDAGANRAWKTLQGKFGSVLGDLSPNIQTADLGAKGVYHRLRAGPFSTRAAADAACASLKAQKQGCLVVAP